MIWIASYHPIDSASNAMVFSGCRSELFGRKEVRIVESPIVTVSSPLAARSQNVLGLLDPRGSGSDA